MILLGKKFDGTPVKIEHTDHGRRYPAVDVNGVEYEALVDGFAIDGRDPVYWIVDRELAEASGHEQKFRIVEAFALLESYGVDSGTLTFENGEKVRV